MSQQEYLTNAQGHLVPREQVKEIDLLRDELVQEKIIKVKDMQEKLRTIKDEIMNDVAAFVSISAERFGVKFGGEKGNVSLFSFDGKYKIIRQVAENLTFDEGLQAAKLLVDECLKEWSKDSPSELRAIIDQAFRVDRQGRINTNGILQLRRLNISDERWQQAMQAISESLQVFDTKAYVRVYERDSHGKYQAISLDIASL